MNPPIEFLCDRDVHGAETGYNESGYTTEGWYFIDETGGFNGPFDEENDCMEAYSKYVFNL